VGGTVWAGIRAREELRRLLRDGRIVLEPQPDHVYLARTELLPLMLLAASKSETPLRGLRSGVSRDCSGGKI
jgi:hypothetical protein